MSADCTTRGEGSTRFIERIAVMSGFRTPEIPREQMVLWERRLDDAIPDDHQVRHLDLLLGSPAFGETFREMEQRF